MSTLSKEQAKQLPKFCTNELGAICKLFSSNILGSIPRFINVLLVLNA